MAFQVGSYAKIWEFTDKGTYGVVNLSSSKKNKDTNAYDTDFQYKFVSVVGNAYQFMKGVTIPKNGLTVKITNCSVTNKYDANKNTTYWNCAVFGLEDPNSSSGGSSNNASQKKQTKVNNEPTPDEDLPF